MEGPPTIRVSGAGTPPQARDEPLPFRKEREGLVARLGRGFRKQCDKGHKTISPGPKACWQSIGNECGRGIEKVLKSQKPGQRKTPAVQR
ncbi:hypothetical protein GCM10009628_38740 [Paeniglutamicibacter kerguelensis]|uniref:Uncharacterized protein n=1 Tax=Paeniglutamicibacter kerguelensis TaxID=254788 RepID=A0ABS4XAJ1_9MICC|nr:hypothetical protein [Paeniglutamicibacter kerguelensis]